MRTAIYCRVSSRGQKDNTSLPEQERLCRIKAAALGWEVSEAHVYHEVESGADLWRPYIDRLANAIQAREIDGVVVDVTDRLARDEGDEGAMYWHAERYGVQIELASQDIDESEHGCNLRTLAAMSARMERNSLIRRTKRGIQARVASGKMLPGARPKYGYLWGDPDTGARTHYVVDPETAPVVIRIFNAVAVGVPIRQIARELEQEGIPTPFQVLEARGQLPEGRTASPEWRRSQINRMMKDPSYWGEHSANRSKNTSEKVRSPSTGIVRKVRRRIERATDDPDRVALPDTCPALVSKELAERVHAQLVKNKEGNPGRLADPLETIWRNMAYCGHCGKRMYTGPSYNGHGRRYNCGSRRGRNTGVVPTSCPGGAFSIGAIVLDPAAWADMRAWLSDEKNVSRLLAEWEREENSVENSATARLEAVAATIRTLHDKMARLVDTIAETEDRESRQVLQERLDTYSDQLRREIGKRERLMAEAKEAADHAKDARDIREWVAVVASRADSFTRLEEVTALRALGAQVTVWEENYVHEDGWPQRYKITLHFTGFTGQSVTLPASHATKHDSDNLSCGQPFDAAVAASSESAWMIE